MRVIAGSARGTRLGAVPRGTRPLSDRAREGLFSSLGAAVVRAGVLDLYAGTGALGIEALSRGAPGAAFVERSAAAIRTIRANLERTHLADRAVVHAVDALRFLRQTDESYDLVLLDPPYATAERDLDAVMEVLTGGKVAPGGIIALTRPDRGYTPVIPVNWPVARRLKYGDSLVVLYREV